MNQYDTYHIISILKHGDRLFSTLIYSIDIDWCLRLTPPRTLALWLAAITRGKYKQNRLGITQNQWSYINDTSVHEHTLYTILDV